MSENHQGKLPKSKESIRASLNAISKDAGVVRESGPMKDGFAADYQITAGTFHARDNARRYQNLLTKKGLFSKLHSSRHGCVVMVDAEDSQMAAELYAIHKKEHPDFVPLANSRRFDYLIFGSIISLTIGFAILGEDFGNPVAHLLFATFLAIGASMGHLFDRLKGVFRSTGKLRIGVWEFLIIATLPALFTLLFSFLPKVIMGQ
ncbi:MAG: hypothetical protein AB8B55_02975 [Mariniblastus sp.]